MNKRLVILLYGYPGSGKTRAAEAVLKMVTNKDPMAWEYAGPLPTGCTATVLNVDTIRYEVNNGVWYDAHTESQVMRHAFVATRALLTTNEVVIVDEAMLMTSGWDRYFTKLFGGEFEDFDVLRVSVDTDIDTAFYRNSNRARIVPMAAYEQMRDSQHPWLANVRLTVAQDTVTFTF